jgi:chromosome segregation ATPase
MSETMEQRFGRIGARLDTAFDRFRHEGHARVDPAVERLRKVLDDLRARLDDLAVQASLAKLETRDRTEPVVEELRDQTQAARNALADLREELDVAAEALREGLSEAAQDLSIGVSAAAHSRD